MKIEPAFTKTMVGRRRTSLRLSYGGHGV